MMPDDWEPVARNMFDLLKAGGYLQWIEANLPQHCVALRNDPEASCSTAQKVLSMLRPTLAKCAFPADNLAPILQSVGFQTVLDEVTSSDRLSNTRRTWTECITAALAGYVPKLEGLNGSNRRSNEEVEELINAMYTEAASGMYVRSDLHTFVGIKGPEPLCPASDTGI